MLVSKIAAAVFVVGPELLEVGTCHASLMLSIRTCVTVMEITMPCIFVPVYPDIKKTQFICLKFSAILLILSV